MVAKCIVNYNLSILLLPFAIYKRTFPIPRSVKTYYQLWIGVVSSSERNVICFYCWMTRKTQLSYESVLERLEYLAGNKLAVKNIVTDQVKGYFVTIPYISLLIS